MFFDRKMELDQLIQMYASDRAELYVLYGRRRVGKTELLRAFCSDRPHLFFIATLSADAQQLASFSQQIWAFTHPVVPEGFTFPSWESAFRELVDLPGRPVVVLDEFTYLISGNKAIPSILQKVWDEVLKKSRVMLVLSGSYIGMMETEILGYQAPLYGRRTASRLLLPLDLPTAAEFFPAYSADSQFLAWAVLGGMPYYLLTFSDRLSVLENIRRHILDAQSGELFNEPRLLLMEELREPRNYFSILRAIAQGHTRLNEIVQASTVEPATSVARYLDLLQQLHLVSRRVPATEKRPEKSKKGLYQIDDHFLRFWFRYVHSNLGALDLGLADSILEQRIRPDLDHFASMAFEEAGRNYTARLAQAGQLSFIPDRIGGWWSREAEIDVLAVSDAERSILVGECKWSVNPVGSGVITDLKRKMQILTRETSWARIEMILFSRAGFTAACRDQAAADQVRLVEIEQMVV